MKAISWPNALGWDVGSSEVMKVASGLRVHTTFRCALVTSTSDPVEAVKLTRRSGHVREDLEGMDYSDANRVFRGTVL